MRILAISSTALAVAIALIVGTAVLTPDAEAGLLQMGRSDNFISLGDATVISVGTKGGAGPYFNFRVGLPDGPTLDCYCPAVDEHELQCERIVLYNRINLRGSVASVRGKLGIIVNKIGIKQPKQGR